MNEIDLVRDLLPERPPPAGDVRARALNLLEDDMSAPRRRRSPAFVPRLRIGLAGLTAVGAAAAVGAVVLGIGVAGNGVTPAPGGSEPASGPGSARTVLLAAAERAEKEPTGRYWRVQTVDGQAYRVGSAGGGYTVLGYSAHMDKWKARSMDYPDVIYGRDLGARPLEPADEAAWRKAGSPKTFEVVSNGDRRVLSTVPGRTRGSLRGTWDDGDVSTPAEKRRNAAQVAKICAVKRYEPGVCPKLAPGEDLKPMAADPARLRRALFPSRPGAGYAGDAAHRLMNGFDFLTERAASPQVRATVFRLLAEQEGVRSLGAVRDPRGRPGIGLAARGTMQSGSGTVFDYQLILEPKTYRILSGAKVVVRPGGRDKGMRPGAVHSQQVVLSIGWTNDEPRHP